MQHHDSQVFAASIADQAVSDRFGRTLGLHTFNHYLDYLDAYSTAHLDDRMAQRVHATTGAQRRNSRLIVGKDSTLMAVPLKDPRRSGVVLWAEVDLSVWLDLMTDGATGAWYYEHKGRDRRIGQVRMKSPMRKGLTNSNVTIARLIVGAKRDQQARTVDGNPLNLRRANLYLRSGTIDVEGRRVRAKTDTRKQLMHQVALRESLTGKEYGFQDQGHAAGKGGPASRRGDGQ